MAVLMGIVVKSSIDIPLTACSMLAWKTFGSVGGGVSTVMMLDVLMCWWR